MRRATMALAGTTAVVLAVTGIAVGVSGGDDDTFEDRAKEGAASEGDPGPEVEPGTGPVAVDPHPGGGFTVPVDGADLVAFEQCDDLVSHLGKAASDGPDVWALGNGGMGMMRGGFVDDMAMADGEMAMEAMESAPTAAGGDAGGGVDVSDTNVQVAGVDEPDLVETDGQRLWTAAGGSLQVVDVTGDEPRVLSTTPLELGSEPQLLLSGDRLLALSNTWGVRPMLGAAEDLMLRDAFAPETAQTNLDLYDVSADEPRLVASADFEGSLVAARGVDGTVHLVLAHRPQPLPPVALQQLWNAPDETTAREVVRTAVADTRPESWLPMMSTATVAGPVSSGPTMDCDEVAGVEGAPDTGMLQVLTLDMGDDDLAPEGRAGVVTDGMTVSATADQLVVAAPVWSQQGPASTDLHLFDLDPSGATFVGSGSVPGQVLNQFSMSFHEGHVQVATTVEDWQRGTSESVVSILARDGDALEVVGDVGGLGRGEQIHSVRFMGDRGYVVTFRQVDPLYTLDLSDPTAPSVEGELKITGYSAYLHPLAGDRLLGVGQEATLEGRTTGTQVSMFDVSDPANPTRLAQVQLPNSWSEGEMDHHAVLVHDDLMALPYERWGEPTEDMPEGYETAAMVVGLGERTLDLRGTIDQSDGQGQQRLDPWSTRIRRVVVVGDRLVTISPAGIGMVDRGSLAPTGFVRF